jgi:recombination protein RecT
MNETQIQNENTTPPTPAEVSTLASFYERIQRIFGESRKALAEVLPPSLPVERYVRTALTLWRTDEKIQKCEPLSFAGVVMEAANLHLSLDPNLAQAYVVPRYDRKRRGTFASLLVGYPGLVKLARDSGQVVDFTASLVRERDNFDFALGTSKFLRHSWPLGLAERGKVVGGYLFVKLTSGEQHIFLMTAADLDAARERVLAENGIRLVVGEDGVERGMRKGDHGEYEADSPWISDPEPMKVKTLIRRGSKTIPLGDGYTRAVALDEAADHDRPQNLAENLRGILPEMAGAPAGADDTRAQMATQAAAEALAAKIRATAPVPEPPPTPASEPPAPAVAPSAAEPVPAAAPATAAAPVPAPAAAEAPVPEEPIPGAVEPFVGSPSGLTAEEMAEWAAIFADKAPLAVSAGTAAATSLDTEIARMQAKLVEAKARKAKGRRPAKPAPEPAPATEPAAPAEDGQVGIEF